VSETTVPRTTGSRAARKSGLPGTPFPSSPFRLDRDRIVASPFFARLAGVTQVVSPTGSGLLVHNRLTHSLKVAQLARAIAERLLSDAQAARLLHRLGGLDPDVVEAAGLAHDLGHPPFGHLGEQVLDRLARERFGLEDGFEGNAQSLRIVTTTDVRGPAGTGLDLTAAVRAALLKYPWTRLDHPSPHPRHAVVPPRGAGEPAEAPGSGSAKFSAYRTELDDLLQARAPFAGVLAETQQTVEAAVMDTADDVAYAIHDLEDFHRAGVLQHAPVAAELGGWLDGALDFAGLSGAEVVAGARRSGHSLEALRRRLHAKDSWVVHDDAFAAAVRRVQAELVDGLLARPFDGSILAEQAVAGFSQRWTERLLAGVVVRADPPPRAAHVGLDVQQWHEVAVLKFVHHRFVLARPDLALHQRGQASLLTTLVEALREWLTDRHEWHEQARLPSRLDDLVSLACEEYSTLGVDKPERLAVGRAVVDFVASLTDAQAVALLDVLSGRSSHLWTDALVL
jgi:dGTPase